MCGNLTSSLCVIDICCSNWFVTCKSSAEPRETRRIFKEEMICHQFSGLESVNVCISLLQAGSFRFYGAQQIVALFDLNTHDDDNVKMFYAEWTEKLCDKSSLNFIEMHFSTLKCCALFFFLPFFSTHSREPSLTRLIHVFLQFYTSSSLFIVCVDSLISHVLLM